MCERRLNVRTLDEIIQKYKNGDIEAMSVLVETYKNELYNLCFRLTFNKHDADDLFQQTWIKAARHSSKFNGDSFRPWLFRICINQHKDNYRAQNRRKKIFKENFESTYAKDYVLVVSQEGESVEQQLEKKHIQALLISNIGKLPTKQKMPIILYYYQQMKYSQIAQVLGIPEGTVKSRINTAKKTLKSVMEGELYV